MLRNHAFKKKIISQYGLRYIAVVNKGCDYGDPTGYIDCELYAIKKFLWFETTGEFIGYHIISSNEEMYHAYCIDYAKFIKDSTEIIEHRLCEDEVSETKDIAYDLLRKESLNCWNGKC